MAEGGGAIKDAGFKELLQSLEEARAMKAGTRKPSRIIRFDRLQVKAIRKKFHVSQTQFAYIIGVSPATLRNWEQGRTYPEGAARVLLKVAAKRPHTILEALRS